MKLSLKNIASFSSVTALGQLLPFLALPIVTRLYSPEDFAGLAQLLLFATVVLVFSTLRLEHVFIGLKQQRVAQVLFGQLLLFSSVASVIASVIYVTINNADDVLLFIFGGMLLSGMAFYALASSYAITRGKIKQLGYSRVLKGVLDGILPILFSLFLNNEKGLILSLALSFIIPCGLLMDKRLYRLRLNPFLLPYFTLRFSRFEILSGMLNSASSALPVFVIAAKFDLHAAGIYAFLNRYFAAVASLGLNSLGVIFRAAAANEFKVKGAYAQSFSKTIAYSVLGSLIFMIGVAGVTAFGWEKVLGAEWIAIDAIVYPVAILYAIRIITLPVSYSFYISNALSLNLKYQAALFSTVVLGVSFIYMGLSFDDFVWAFTSMLAVFYMTYLFGMYKLSRGA